MRHPFDSAARAPGIDVPVLVVHGREDAVIPVHHGRELATRFPNARYVEVSGGHGETLPVVRSEARAAYQAFLDAAAGPTAAR